MNNKCVLISTIVIFSLLLFLAPNSFAEENQDWPMFGQNPRRTGFVDAEAVEYGNPIWSFETGDAITSSPVISDGRVFVSSYDGYLYALDAGSGEKLWSSSIGEWKGFGVPLLGGVGDRLMSTPAVDDERVYVGSFDKGVYSFDVEDGVREWYFETGDRVDSSPLVVDDVVYVGSRDNSLYALDAGSGEELWSYETDGSVTSSPAYFDGSIFVGSRDDNFYSVSADDGELNWYFETGDLVHSTPAVDNGEVYFGSRDGSLYVLDADDGELIWEESILPLGDSSYINNSPAVGYESVFFGAYNYHIYSYSRASRERNWDFATDYRVGYSSPAVLGGQREIKVSELPSGFSNFYEVLGSLGTFYTIQLMFFVLFLIFLGYFLIYGNFSGGGISVLAIALLLLILSVLPWIITQDRVEEISEDRMVYSGSYDGSFYAISGEEGEKVWSFDVLGYAIEHGYVVASPAYYDDMIFATSSIFESSGSKVYALGSPVDVEIENLETQDNAKSGENLEVHLKVKNVTDAEGDYVLRFMVEPQDFVKMPWIETKQVSLSPNESKEVTFSLSYDKGGEYIITSPDSENSSIFEIIEEVEEKEIPEGYDHYVETQFGMGYYTDNVTHGEIEKSVNLINDVLLGTDDFIQDVEDPEIAERVAQFHDFMGGVDHLASELVTSGFVERPDENVRISLKVEQEPKDEIIKTADELVLYEIVQPILKDIYQDNIDFRLIDSDREVFYRF